MTTQPPRREPRPDAIARAMAGWQPARVLMSANRLDVFNALGDQLLSVREIARACGAHPRSTRLLLNACVALGFLRKQNNRYGNTPEGLQLLVRGKPTYMGDGINHSDWLWRTWGRLAEAVRTNKPVIASADPGAGPTIHRDFILAMHDRAMHTGEALAEALDLSGRRQLFDAGGGPGTYSCFLARKYPELRCIVFDLPPTVPIASEVIASFGLQDRVTTRAGDYFRDDFGQGNDVVLLSAIVHAMPPRRAKQLLRKAHDSLVSGGLVVVHENLIDSSKTSPTSAVLFSLNMLVNTGHGRSYSGAEISAWMREAGFAKPQVIRLPAPAATSLVTATKPQEEAMPR
ncbi:MAG: methyltransferase [Dehalococcoidia bacterium]